MITKILNDDLTYDGTQLSSHFINDSAGLSGDASLAFFGPADVPTENLVDKEDRLAGSIIESKRMVHFLVRLEGRSLDMAVAFQRLVMADILELLVKSTGQPGFLREGDDIYLAGGSGLRKLTVSIATDNRAGDSFIHIGVNVTGEGAPVPAIGLADIGLDEKTFATGVLRLIDREFSGLVRAASKVRQVE